MKNFRGFTLIELLVVIGVIGGLSAIGIFSFVGAQKSARDTRRQSDLRQYQTAVEVYANRNGGLYPNPNGTGISDLSSMCGGTLLNLPSCPDDATTGENYNYSTNASRTDYVMWVQMERKNSSGNDEYFILCSEGKAGKLATEPASAVCPASL